MNYFETFNPAILLGDRLGLTLYAMFVEAHVTGDAGAESEMYRRFIGHFPGERASHTPEIFGRLIESVRRDGLDPFRPVYGNPAEYSLIDGSHRCAIAIHLGLDAVPVNIRFQDDRVDDSTFSSIFSAAELDLIRRKQTEYIDRCDPPIALRCRIRALMRNGGESFRAPFSSKTKIPTLRPYQGLEAIGITGKRPSEKRLDIYELRQYLRGDMTVLEFGCNVGFFALTLAPHVGRIDGFDVDPTYIAIANLVRQHRGNSNAQFFQATVGGLATVDAYDLVVSTAVHGWSGLPFAAYLERISQCLRPGGLLLFESHEIDAERDWPDKRAALLAGHDLLASGLIDDVDRGMYASEMREFLVLRKHG